MDAEQIREKMAEITEEFWREEDPWERLYLEHELEEGAALLRQLEYEG